MSFKTVLHGDPKKILEELLDVAWDLSGSVTNESGGDPHLYHRDNDSYYDNQVHATIYCGRIYSNQGWSHDCGISFHTWLSEGKCNVWSQNGHSRQDSKENWGTCRAMSDFWYTCVAEVKARRSP